MLRGKCVEGRWHEKVKAALPDGEIVFSRGSDDYQGSVAIVAKLDDGRWLQYGWSYGSCSGCDSWDDRQDYRLTDENLALVAAQIDKEILASAGIMSKAEMKSFCESARDSNANWISDSDSYDYESHAGLSYDELISELAKE